MHPSPPRPLACPQRSTVKEGSPDHENHSADGHARTEGGVACAGCPRRGQGEGGGQAVTERCQLLAPPAPPGGSLEPVSRATSCRSGQKSNAKRWSGPFQVLTRTPGRWKGKEAEWGLIQGVPLKNAATTGPCARQVLPSAGAQTSTSPAGIFQ